MTATQKNLRIFVPYIRFSLMDEKFFATKVVPQNILTAEEGYSVFNRYHVHDHATPFRTESRERIDFRFSSPGGSKGGVVNTNSRGLQLTATHFDVKDDEIRYTFFKGSCSILICTCASSSNACSKPIKQTFMII